MFAPFAETAFDAPLYRDVDAEILAVDEPEPRTALDFLTQAWPEFLRRLLPPVGFDEAVA